MYLEPYSVYTTFGYTTAPPGSTPTTVLDSNYHGMLDENNSVPRSKCAKPRSLPNH